MTPEEKKKKKAINWLKENKEAINVSFFARETGVQHLSNVINERKDSKGFIYTFPNKDLPALYELFSKMKIKP